MQNQHHNNEQLARSSVVQFGRVPYAVVTSGVLATIKPAATTIYLVLLAHVDEHWRASVGMRRIASLAGVLLSSVSRSVAQLEASGLVAIDEIVNGERFTYTITTATSSPLDRSPASERFKETGVRTTTNGFQSDRSPTGEQPAPSTVRSPANVSTPSRSPVGAPTVRPSAQNRSLTGEQNRRTDKRTETKNAAHSSCAPSNDMPPQAHADDTTLSDAQAPLKGFDLVFGLTGPDAGKPALATRTPKPQKPACTVRQAEAIYAAYPRRVGKRVALVAIQRAVRRLADEGHADPVERLTERTTAYAASPAGQHPLPGNNDYRPYPATWFNHDRFDDDPDEWSKPNGEHNRSTIAQSVEGNSSPQRIAAERRAQQAQREYGEHIDVPEL